MSTIHWEDIYLEEYGTTPQETVIALYHSQKLCLEKVSKQLGVSRKALVVFMKKYNIDRRKSGHQKGMERKKRMLKAEKRRMKKCLTLPST